MIGRDYKAKFETRDENDKKYIEGYFVRFDDRYIINEKTYETVDPQAFRNMGSHNIISLWNHNSDFPLGTTENRTANFRADAVGIWGSVEINEEDPMAVAAYARVKRGDVPHSSFGFNVEQETMIRHEDGTVEFRLLEVDVHEFSPCTFAAYQGTAIAARSQQIFDMEKHCIDERKQKLKERLLNIGPEDTTA